MFVHFEQILVMLLHSPMEVCAVKCMWLLHKNQLNIERTVYIWRYFQIVGYHDLNSRFK
jgi:hypothetical protein